MYDPDADILAKLVAEHVCDGLVLTDPEGKILWINPAFERLCGYELHEIIGKRPGEVLQGNDTSPHSRARLAEAIATQTRCRVDIVNYDKAGSAYISEIHLGPIFDDDGQLTHFVAVQRDVTRERALAQESIDYKTYQRALDQQAIISATDARGRITYVNSKFSSISGYTSEELIGQNHRIVNSGRHNPSFFRDMWQSIRAGQTWHGEICNITKGGDLYWVDTNIVPVHGAGGEIVRYVSTRYEVTKRKAVEDELRRIAETDDLTGLANRARFAKDLAQRITLSGQEPTDQGGLLIMFDLDHFKELNDTLGHHCGDQLLQEIGQRLMDFTGPNRVVARLGGDEFAAFIPAEAYQNAPEEYLRSLHAFTSKAVSLSDTIYLPSFSMGVTLYPQDAQTVEGLLINADVALYEAKHNGRNQWCIFDQSVRGKLICRNHLKAILADALDNDRFQIALQPFCKFETGAHSGFEVLVRLDDEGSPVAPDLFIPLAEELGFISRIGRVVMQKAMAARQAMVQAGLRPGKFAINVSAPELREPCFALEVQELLAQHDIPPTELVIEITETALIGRSTQTVASTLQQLHESGVGLALDDFGTGFSSLSHLRDFHVDKIKIDKSFVHDLEEDASDRALVDGLISLARRLGIEVVAEGVETTAQRDYLRSFGCDYLQGFIHSRPLTVKAADGQGCDDLSSGK
ncbi:putative bifunctional diguanylate cyclase/phosphodiesterase [Pseudooceanicola spongiae]|nr:EAL domain-containing protein [Pseudooceanicola spongiae]